jgi:murein DD-endopeptidase MepM/ murein hydrolase activator NlpD
MPIYNKLSYFHIGARFAVKNFFRQNSKTLPRLALILCALHFLMSFGSFIPNSRSARWSKAETQNGVGGGTLVDAVITENDAALIQETENLEAGVLEPEAFSKPRLLLYDTYTIQKGDMISSLAEGFGLNQDTLISVNSIKNTRLIQPGQVLKVPNQDGIFYTVKKDDTLENIAEKYKAEPEAIQIVNELFSENPRPGVALFIPGAQLDWTERQEINGDLFIWPIRGYITSLYGYRRSPFTGVRQFHSGLDIGSPAGTSIKAAMAGRVSAVGWDDVLGNFVVISHHSGYRTLYGHMSAIKAKSGALVTAGETIGYVGSTGLSTGPHLHFTVYKNGVTVNPRALMK